MQHSEFKIGTEFTTATGRWRCTDVGQRTIVAIKLDREQNSSWYAGPPFAIAEQVFDEEDVIACRLCPPQKKPD